MPRILVDLSHNERYSQIPKNVFDFTFTFEFLYSGMQFPDITSLREYDMVIIGDIIPAKNEKDHLFLNSEIELLKEYVKQGGKLLISSSSGGDQDYLGQDEDIEDYRSIRALSMISGVKRYWWGEVFHEDLHPEDLEPEDLDFTSFPNHPIFQNVLRILLSDTTFLEPSNVFPTEILFSTQPKT